MKLFHPNQKELFIQTETDKTERQTDKISTSKNAQVTEEIESSLTNKAQHTETSISYTGHGRFLLIQDWGVRILVLFYDGDYQGDELGPEIQVPDAGALFLRRKVLILVLGRKPLENQCKFKGERKSWQM